jgi:hypothetical protein
MALIDGEIAHSLAHQVRADRPAFQTILVQDVALGLHVRIIFTDELSVRPN